MCRGDSEYRIHTSELRSGVLRGRWAISGGSGHREKMEFLINLRKKAKDKSS